MKRRAFLRSGLALGAAGGGGLLVACAPAVTSAPPVGAAPVAARRAGRPLRLSANENPLGLGPAARRALLETIGESNRYPGEAQERLRSAIAAQHGLVTDQVQLGTGSTEILRMVVHQAAPGTTFVVADPTFEDVPQYATAIGRRVEKVPLRADWAHDLERMRETARASAPALVFICNPNNPTGTLTPCDEVDAWIAEADERTTFVVDEAYFDFAEDPGYRSAVRWIASRPNVVVVRTFSKIHAMAGMRLGYALAQPSTIRRLRLWACHNNANVLALAVGLASLGDAEFQRRSLEVNRAGRRMLQACLDQLGLAHLPSHTNFVMHRITGSLPTYIARMRERGVWVGRPFPPLLEYNRVSIGLPEEMEAFVEELRSFRAQSWV